MSSLSLRSGLGSLPNTRNKISKWSIRRFGVDVTEMGPPPHARVAGNLIVLHRSNIYLTDDTYSLPHLFHCCIDMVVGTGADKAAFATDTNTTTTTDDQQVSQHSKRRHGATVTIQEERKEELIDTESGGDVKKSLRGGSADGTTVADGNEVDNSSSSGDGNNGGSITDGSSSSSDNSESSSNKHGKDWNRIAKEWKNKLARKTHNKDSRPKSIVNAIFNRRNVAKTTNGEPSSTDKQRKQRVTKGSGQETTTTSTGGGKKGGRTKGGGTLGGGF